MVLFAEVAEGERKESVRIEWWNDSEIHQSQSGEARDPPRYGLLRIACIPDDWARLFRFRATEFALAGGALAVQANRSLPMRSESAAFIDPTG